MTMAYLDPGTGTMIVSAVVGVLATVALGLKTIWYGITYLFSRKKDGPPSGQS